MCSIGGFIANKPISAVAADSLCTALLYYGRDRGDQSGGVYANGQLFKKAADPFEVANTPEFSAIFEQPTQYALIHTRQPTCGGVGDAQAQPFVAGRTITVHNGWFLNTDELKKAWTIKKKSGVDSELVTQFVNSYGINKLPKFLKSASGSAAFGIIHEDQLYLMRDGNPTFWTIIDFGDVQIFVFASTGKMLSNSIRHAFLVPNDQPIQETKEGILFRCNPSKGLEKLSSKVSAKHYQFHDKHQYMSRRWNGHDAWGYGRGYNSTELRNLQDTLGDYGSLISDTDITHESRILDEASGHENDDKYEDVRYFVPHRGSDKKD